MAKDTDTSRASELGDGNGRYRAAYLDIFWQINDSLEYPE